MAIEVLKTFESIDTDQSGKIDYTEFLAVTMEKNVYLKEEKLYAAFKLFDLNGDGLISQEELSKVLGSSRFSSVIQILGDNDYNNVDKSYWKEIINSADLNDDGMVI